jgi:hypothetical protein
MLPAHLPIRNGTFSLSCRVPFSLLLLVNFHLFYRYISLILSVPFPYFAGTFTLFCRYISLLLQEQFPSKSFLILRVHFPYSSSAFYLFCGYISLILPVHFVILLVYFPSAGTFYPILQVHFSYSASSLILLVYFSYSAGTFPLFCRYTSLIMLVHFLILLEHFLFCWCISLTP